MLLALVFVAVSLLLLTSMLQRTSGSASVTDRNNAYNRAVGAAEAATEKVLSHMTRDFVNQTFDPANLGAYRGLIPTENWSLEYEFSNGAGVAGQTWADCSPTMVLTNLDSQFAGLYGRVYLCSVRANAQSRFVTHPDLTVAVRQSFQLASIPIFQFAVYYAMDLEINPVYAMRVTGKVHGNADIYTSPSMSVEFMDTVGAVGKIHHRRHPNDPGWSSGTLPTYNSLHEEKVSSLTLPVGASNSPAAVRQILDPPPPGENPAALPGNQRYYNKADLIVTTTDSSVSVKFNVDGKGNGFQDIPNDELVTAGAHTFLKTNAAFYDYREGKPVLGTEIDVGKFSAWMATNGTALSVVSARGRALNSIYVDDQRVAAGRLTIVSVTNGRALPPKGLTIATPRPLYVKGHFNAPDLTVGSTSTAGTLPASLVGDSITILSGAWQDDYTPTTTLLDRDAVSTTVNAALLAGIVPTANIGGVNRYSGGLDNFPRFMENWSDGVYATLTFNGSMVVLFPSRYATNYWSSSGTYYTAPTRKWAFDVNFLNWNKLPPGTPLVQKLVRGRWGVIAADSSN